jgi:putative ABC transport system permease protein
VQHAASAYCLPVRGGCDQVLFESVPPAGDAEWPVALNMVGGDYFAALGVPVLEGRAFDARDVASAEPFVVLSASAARQYFPGTSPIGRSVKVGIGWPERAEGARVVGVVGDVVEASLDGAAAPMLYLPSAQFAYPENLAIVRAQPGQSAEALAPELHRMLARIAPDYALFDVATMDERFDGLTARRRFAAQVVGALAALAVALALTGTYAVFDLVVRRRRREFGVRLALGATGAQLRSSVLRGAARLGLVSAGLGALVAVVAMRSLAGTLPDIARGAGWQALLVALAMASLAVLATWWPSRNASRVDPMESLRES